MLSGVTQIFLYGISFVQIFFKKAALLKLKLDLILSQCNLTSVEQVIKDVGNIYTTLKKKKGIYFFICL